MFCSVDIIQYSFFIISQLKNYLTLSYIAFNFSISSCEVSKCIIAEKNKVPILIKYYVKFF